MFLYRLIIQVIIGILGLWLADKFVPGVIFDGQIFLVPKSLEEIGIILKTLVGVGAILGLLNFFVKPILNTIALPLRIITFNLFSLVINIALIWVVDIFSVELNIEGVKAFFWTAIIIWALSLIIPKGKLILSQRAS